MAEVSMPMAKKSEGRRKPGPVPGAGPQRRQVAGFKSSPEFEAWMDRLGKHCRLPTATLIEHGLIALAKERGFEEEPPER